MQREHTASGLNDAVLLGLVRVEDPLGVLSVEGEPAGVVLIAAREAEVLDWRLVCCAA